MGRQKCQDEDKDEDKDKDEDRAEDGELEVVAVRVAAGVVAGGVRASAPAAPAYAPSAAGTDHISRGFRVSMSGARTAALRWSGKDPSTTRRSRTVVRGLPTKAEVARTRTATSRKEECHARRRSNRSERYGSIDRLGTW